MPKVVTVPGFGQSIQLPLGRGGGGNTIYNDDPNNSVLIAVTSLFSQSSTITLGPKEGMPWDDKTAYAQCTQPGQIVSVIVFGAYVALQANVTVVPTSTVQGRIAEVDSVGNAVQMTLGATAPVVVIGTVTYLATEYPLGLNFNQFHSMSVSITNGTPGATVTLESATGVPYENQTVVLPASGNYTFPVPLAVDAFDTGGFNIQCLESFTVYVTIDQEPNTPAVLVAGYQDGVNPPFDPGDCIPVVTTDHTGIVDQAIPIWTGVEALFAAFAIGSPTGTLCLPSGSTLIDSDGGSGGPGGTILIPTIPAAPFSPVPPILRLRGGGIGVTKLVAGSAYNQHNTMLQAKCSIQLEDMTLDGGGFVGKILDLAPGAGGWVILRNIAVGNCSVAGGGVIPDMVVLDGTGGAARCLLENFDMYGPTNPLEGAFSVQQFSVVQIRGGHWTGLARTPIIFVNNGVVLISDLVCDNFTGGGEGLDIGSDNVIVDGLSLDDSAYHTVECQEYFEAHNFNCAGQLQLNTNGGDIEHHFYGGTIGNDALTISPIQINGTYSKRLVFHGTKIKCAATVTRFVHDESGAAQGNIEFDACDFDCNGGTTALFGSVTPGTSWPVGYVRGGSVSPGTTLLEGTDTLTLGADFIVDGDIVGWNGGQVYGAPLNATFIDNNAWLWITSTALSFTLPTVPISAWEATYINLAATPATVRTIQELNGVALGTLTIPGATAGVVHSAVVRCDGTNYWGYVT